jgi:predicted GNAT family acetyltransferase
MSWIPGSKKHEAAVLRLVLQNEALCVPASARIREQAGSFTLYVNGSENGADARECILYTHHGLLLPILPCGGGGDGLERIILERSPSVHSIMGVGDWVRKIESLMPLPPSTSIAYNLMTIASQDVISPAGASSSPVIRRASPSDAEALFPLQKSYENEEVVINPRAFNALQCMRLLKKSLGEELIFFAEKDGVPLAKAGTNARGFGVDQIGGVFTVPEERGKGYAEAVMRVLLTFIFEEKREACLFVKKTNHAANSLYLKLGFKTAEDYLISYYGL